MAAPIKFNNNEYPEDLVVETRVYTGLGLQIKSKLACNQPSTYFANLHLGNIELRSHHYQRMLNVESSPRLR